MSIRNSLIEREHAVSLRRAGRRCVLALLAVSVLGVSGCMMFEKPVENAAPVALSWLTNWSAQPLASTRPFDIELLKPAVARSAIGPQSLLEVTVWDLYEPGRPHTFPVRVSSRETIEVPLLGEQSVTGRSPGELENLLSQEFRRRELLQQPRILVRSLESGHVRVQVTGAVLRPGFVELAREQAGVYDALIAAGSLKSNAGTQILVTRRGSVTSSASRLPPSSYQAEHHADRPTDPSRLVLRGQSPEDRAELQPLAQRENSRSFTSPPTLTGPRITPAREIPETSEFPSADRRDEELLDNHHVATTDYVPIAGDEFAAAPAVPRGTADDLRSAENKSLQNADEGAETGDVPPVPDLPRAAQARWASAERERLASQERDAREQETKDQGAPPGSSQRLSPAPVKPESAAVESPLPAKRKSLNPITLEMETEEALASPASILPQVRVNSSDEIHLSATPQESPSARLSPPAVAPSTKPLLPSSATVTASKPESGASQTGSLVPAVQQTQAVWYDLARDSDLQALQQLVLFDGDSLLVKAAAPPVRIAGSVQRPGDYALPAERTLDLWQAVDLAGGVKPTGTTLQITLLRPPGEGRGPQRWQRQWEQDTPRPRDLPKVQPGDVIDISQPTGSRLRKAVGGLWSH